MVNHLHFLTFFVLFFELHKLKQLKTTRGKPKKTKKNSRKPKKPKNQKTKDFGWFWKTALVFWFSRGFFCFLWFSRVFGFLSLWSPKTKNTCVFLVCAQCLPTKTIKYTVFFRFLGSMSSNNQNNSRKTKENQKKPRENQNQKTKDFAGFGRLLWFFGFLGAQKPKNTVYFMVLVGKHCAQTKKNTCFFLVFGLHSSKNQNNSRKTKEIQKNLENTKKPKQSSKTSKVFGFLVFSRFFWFS